MKTLSGIILVLGLLSISAASNGQNQLKIGHVDIMKILSELPERDSAQVVLDKETKEIESTFEEMQVVYNKLVDDYTNGQSTYSEVVKKAKEGELLNFPGVNAPFDIPAESDVIIDTSKLDIEKSVNKILSKLMKDINMEISFTF